jgi:hypothetical protein
VLIVPPQVLCQPAISELLPLILAVGDSLAVSLKGFESLLRFTVNTDVTHLEETHEDLALK